MARLWEGQCGTVLTNTTEINMFTSFYKKQENKMSSKVTSSHLHYFFTAVMRERFSVAKTFIKYCLTIKSWTITSYVYYVELLIDVFRK